MSNPDRNARNTTTPVANHPPEQDEGTNSDSDYEGDEWGEEGWQEDEWGDEKVSGYTQDRCKRLRFFVRLCTLNSYFLNFASIFCVLFRIL